MEYLKVPVEEIESVEVSRVALYELLRDVGFFENDPCNLKLARLTEITQPLWHVANRKWEKV